MVAVELLPVAGDVVGLLASSCPLLLCLTQCRHFQSHCSLCAPASAALAYLPIPLPPLPRPLHHVMHSLFCPAAALPGLSLRPQRQRKHERRAAPDVPEPLWHPVDAEGDQGRRKRLVNNEPYISKQYFTCSSSPAELTLADEARLHRVTVRRVVHGPSLCVRFLVEAVGAAVAPPRLGNRAWQDHAYTN